MSEWIKFERLPFNDLPLPKYETEQSAGIDFAICLTRQCYNIGTAFRGNAKRNPFWCAVNDEGIIRVATQTEAIEQQIREVYPVLRLDPQETVMVPLGFKSEFDPSYVLQLYVRSSIGMRGIVLANGTGIIDPGYRNDLFAMLHNNNHHEIEINHGDRIVQGILINFSQAIITEHAVSSVGDRGGGFGSTGTSVLVKAK